MCITSETITIASGSDSSVSHKAPQKPRRSFHEPLAARPRSDSNLAGKFNALLYGSSLFGALSLPQILRLLLR